MNPRSEKWSGSMAPATLGILLGALGCSPTVPAPVEADPDIRVPYISAGSVADPAMRACMDPSDPETAWDGREELEPHAAVDPGDPDHIVAAWMTRLEGGPGGIQTSATHDGGVTWSGPVTLPFNACAGGPAGARVTSDPWVAIDAAGRAYVSAIGWSPDEDVDSVSVLLVAVSDASSQRWSTRSLEAVHTRDGMHDNTAVTASRVSPGRAFVTATRYEYGGGEAERGHAAVFETVDGGVTWTGRTSVHPPGADAPIALAPQPLLSPSGSRLWVVFTHDPGGAQIVARASEDLGESWGPLIRVAGWTRPQSWPPHPVSGEALPVAPDIVSAAAGADDQEFWLAYASPVADAPSAVYVARTGDGGDSWAQVRVSPEREVAWRPTLATNASGTAAVTWFRPELPPDSTSSASGAAGDGSFPAAIELRRVTATDGGLAVGPGSTIDRFRWRARRTGTFFLGDYHGLVLTPQKAVAVYARPGPDGIRVRATPAAIQDGGR